MSEHVNAAEAAKVLGCSEAHIRRLIGRGELAATKVNQRWAILRDDLDNTDRPSDNASDRPTVRQPDRPTDGASDRPSEWRDDLLAQVARLEANEDHWRNEMERSKARVIDLERELTVRDSRTADLQAKQEAEVTELLSKQEAEVSELRGQVAVLEAKVREILEKGQDEALQLANRIADLVDRQQASDARIYELQPVAEQVPMLQAAVEEKDASLSERERELGNMRQDIDAIASRPVTGPVFRLLTRGGRLRR